MVEIIIALQLTLIAPAQVIDGDTLRLEGLDQTVRIWGIDAPERHDHGGSAATKSLRAFIAHAPVRCDVKGRDRYDRYVALCRAKNRDLAEYLLTSGHAKEWCRYSSGYYGHCPKNPEKG
ncbi:MAG: thermonuclease family protein [Pseudomonadota bacterium]